MYKMNLLVSFAVRIISSKAYLSAYVAIVCNTNAPAIPPNVTNKGVEIAFINGLLIL